MNDFYLVPVKKTEKKDFIKDSQEAFQYGYEAEYGKCDDVILPAEDIEQSFNTKGSEAYFAVVNNKTVGGAIIVTDEETNHNHLDLLYVKVGCQSKGIGSKIWQSIENLHPETEIWETCTPYFEKRNIHFYVNKCGFHIVEFYNPKHMEPNQGNEQVGGMPDEVGNYFFRFEKYMTK